MLSAGTVRAALADLTPTAEAGRFANQVAIWTLGERTGPGSHGESSTRQIDTETPVLELMPSDAIKKRAESRSVQA